MRLSERNKKKRGKKEKEVVVHLVPLPTLTATSLAHGWRFPVFPQMRSASTPQLKLKPSGKRSGKKSPTIISVSSPPTPLGFFFFYSKTVAGWNNGQLELREHLEKGQEHRVIAVARALIRPAAEHVPEESCCAGGSPLLINVMLFSGINRPGSEQMALGSLSIFFCPGANLVQERRTISVLVSRHFYLFSLFT